MRQHNRAVFLGMVTWELRSFHTVHISEIGAQNCGWISAAFDIYQQNGVICLIGVRTRIVVADVDVGAMVGIAGAAFPARTPSAIRQAS